VSTWTQTSATDEAMLAGVLALLDNDADPAYATLFDSADNALVSLVFAQPAGALVAGELVLQQEDSSGDLINNSGSATYFKLYAGDNTEIGTGSVSDTTGDGIMKLAGTSGTLLLAGGRAILGSFKLV
jgi:hypothetical protein